LRPTFAHFTSSFSARGFTPLFLAYGVERKSLAQKYQNDGVPESVGETETDLLRQTLCAGAIALCAKMLVKFTPDDNLFSRKPPILNSL